MSRIFNDALLDALRNQELLGNTVANLYVDPGGNRATFTAGRRVVVVRARDGVVEEFYDPDQPRDAEGQWSGGIGGGGSGSPGGERERNRAEREPRETPSITKSTYDRREKMLKQATKDSAKRFRAQVDDLEKEITQKLNKNPSADVSSSNAKLAVAKDRLAITLRTAEYEKTHNTGAPRKVIDDWYRAVKGV